MKKFNGLIYTFPFILSLVVLLIHDLMTKIREEIPIIELLPKEFSLFDAFVFLLLTVISSIAILVIFKKSLSLLKIIFILSALFLIFASYLLLLSIIMGFLLAFIIDAFLVVLALLTLMYQKFRIYSSILFIAMVIVGCILNFSLPPSTKFVLLAVYSLFDLYSVQKGFLKTIIGQISRLYVFSPLMIRIDSLSMGVGDIVFFSLISSFSLDYDLIAFCVVTICLIVGFLINLRLLNKKRVIPGLPIPILLSLSCLFIYSLVFS